MFKHLVILLALLSSSYMLSQQLVYKPVNPAFGGDTFNYQWMLSSATAQDSTEDPAAAAGRGGLDDRGGSLQQFTDGLNRQFLNLLSREVVGLDFREGGVEPGTFTFGSLEVEVLETIDGLVINILDVTTAEQTQIIVPN